MRVTLDSLDPYMSPNDRQLMTMQAQMYRRLQQTNQSVVFEDIWALLFSWY